MKIRLGFVSNSSTSSFLAIFVRITDIKKDQCIIKYKHKLIDAEMYRMINEFYKFIYNNIDDYTMSKYIKNCNLYFINRLENSELYEIIINHFLCYFLDRIDFIGDIKQYIKNDKYIDYENLSSNVKIYFIAHSKNCYDIFKRRCIDIIYKYDIKFKDCDNIDCLEKDLKHIIKFQYI